VSINAGEGGAIGTTAAGAAAGAFVVAVADEGGGDSLQAPAASAATIKKNGARELNLARIILSGLRVASIEGRIGRVNPEKPCSTCIDDDLMSLESSLMEVRRRSRGRFGRMGNVTLSCVGLDTPAPMEIT